LFCIFESMRTFLFIILSLFLTKLAAGQTLDQIIKFKILRIDKSTDFHDGTKKNDTTWYDKNASLLKEDITLIRSGEAYLSMNTRYTYLYNQLDSEIEITTGEHGKLLDSSWKKYKYDFDEKTSILKSKTIETPEEITREEYIYHSNLNQPDSILVYDNDTSWIVNNSNFFTTGYGKMIHLKKTDALRYPDKGTIITRECPFHKDESDSSYCIVKENTVNDSEEIYIDKSWSHDHETIEKYEVEKKGGLIIYMETNMPFEEKNYYEYKMNNRGLPVYILTTVVKNNKTTRRNTSYGYLYYSE
jgi:hypothetical protein